MSFEERPPSRLSGLLSKVLAAVAVVALLAAVALGGLFFLGNRGPSPSPTASPSARPSPTVALQRFLALASNPKRAYHVKFVTVVDTSGTDTEIRGDMDVSGNDWHATLTTKSGSKTVRAETIGKFGKAYIRTPGGKWSVVPQAAAAAAARAADPFSSAAGLDVLVDMGVVTRAGKKLHWLHTGELAGADQTMRNLGLTGKVEMFSFDVWVTDAGIPVQAALKMSLSATAGSTTLTMTFDISRFGKAVKITAPRV